MREGGMKGEKKGGGDQGRVGERDEEAMLLSIFTSGSSPCEDIVQVLVPQGPLWYGPQRWLAGAAHGEQEGDTMLLMWKLTI